MNRLTTNKRAAVVSALVEGMSINAACRMTGAAKHTVLKLLKDMGCACATYHNAHVRNLRVRRIQADEIWAFVYGKDKNLTLEQVQAGAGSVWTWTALDADTELIVSYMLGDRGAATALSLMRDVAGRIANRIQLTTDGHRVYAEAVEDAFGADIDYAMLVKIYGASSDGQDVGLGSTNQPLAVEFQVGVRIPTFRLTPVAAHTEREKMRTLMKSRRRWSRVRITKNIDPTVNPMNTATVSPMSG